MRNSKGQFVKGNTEGFQKGHKFCGNEETQFKKGQIPWNRGKKGVDEKTRQKMRLKKIGKKLSKSHIENISKALKGRKNYWLIGNKNNWRGGITPQNKKIRNSIEWKQWRKMVFIRDNYRCWICEERTIDLEPHHLKRFSEYPKSKFVVSNGLTLCRFCHKTYTKFGIRKKNLSFI